MQWMQQISIILFTLFICGCTGDPPENLDSFQIKKCLASSYITGKISRDDFEDICEGKFTQIEPAYVVEREDDEYTLSLYHPSYEDDPQNNSEGFEFFAYPAKDILLQIGSKVHVSGVIDGRSWTGLAKLKDAVFTEKEPTAEETAALASRAKKGSFDANKWARDNRAAALMEQAEGDAELAKYAREQRAEYKAKAIQFQSMTKDGVTIDSFELPGNVFMACTLSYPGPVYSCDETTSQ